MTRPNFGFTPDLSKAGAQTKPAEDAKWVWFSPSDAPESRFRYAVIKEEDGILSIQPGEARFKKGLDALRWDADKGGTSSRWVVEKTKPNRIDLRRADG